MVVYAPTRKLINQRICMGDVVPGSTTYMQEIIDRALHYHGQLGESTSAFGGAQSIQSGFRAVSTTNASQRKAFMFNTGPVGVGGDPLDVNTITDLVPLVEDATKGESRGTSKLRYLINREEERGIHRAHIYHSSGRPGALVGYISKGTVPYNNTLLAANIARYYDRLYNSLTNDNKMLASAVALSIGANDRDEKTDEALYLSQLLALFDDTDCDFRKITGQARKVWTVICQLVAADTYGINPPYWYSTMQFDAVMRSNKAVISVTPYFLNLYINKDLSITPGAIENSYVHMDPKAISILGEYDGEAEFIIDRAMELNPNANLGDTVPGLGAALGESGNDFFGVGLWIDPNSLVVNGTSLQFDLVGRYAATSLIDTITIPDVGLGKGFFHSTKGEGNLVEVATINQNRKRWAMAKAGNPGFLRYAARNNVNATTFDSLSAAAGNIRDVSPRRSIADQGRYLHNWLQAFKIDVPL